MNKMKRSYEKKKIDFEKYVNTDTGEPLSSEIRGAISINVRNENKIFMNSTSYFTIDDDMFDYLSEHCNDAQIGKVFKMCRMVRGEYNLLFDAETKIPHTRKTLMEKLDLSVNKFRDFINHIRDKQIIHTVIEDVDGVKETWYMMNPYFARKQKGFNSSCVENFQNLKIDNGIQNYLI